MLGQPMFLPQPRRARGPGHRRAPRRDDGHRPGPDADADAPSATAWWGPSSSSSATGCRRCRWPIAPRSRTCVPSTEPRPRTSRSMTRRSATSPSPDGRLVDLVERYTKRPRVCSAATATRSRGSARSWTSTSRAVEPSVAGPKRPQDRVASRRGLAVLRGGLPRRSRARSNVRAEVGRLVDEEAAPRRSTRIEPAPRSDRAGRALP